jgi:hypothetical protein
MEILRLMYEGSENEVSGRSVLRRGNSALAAGFALIGVEWVRFAGWDQDLRFYC